MDDRDIILMLCNRNSEGITRIQEKYEAYCFKIAENILGNKEDAEECVNDLWFRVWEVIPAQKPVVLKLYLAKIIRNIAIDRVKQYNTVKNGKGETFFAIEELEECTAGKVDVAGEYEAKEIAKSIQKFLETLKKRELKVFLRRYFYADSIADIANMYHLTQKNVTVILTRTRKKIKEHLRKEGFVE